MPPSTLGIFVVAILVVLGGFMLFIKHKSSGSECINTQSSDATVDDYVASHGEPEAVFVLDITRSNELNAVVLVYEHEIVIEGTLIERDKIADVSFYNAQNPYLDKEYHLVFTTTIPDKPTIEAHIGNDAQYAKDIATQLAKHLHIG